MNISKAIQHIYPDAQFAVWDNKYESIAWEDKRPIPTIDELLLAWDEIVKSNSQDDPKTEWEIKEKRDRILSRLDFISTRHRDQVESSLQTSLTNEQHLDVLVLKQKLRDIPQQSGFPDSIIWPTVPDFLQSKFEAL